MCIHLLPIFSTLTCRINTDWLWDHYPPDFRHASIIYMSENVLTPEVIQAMYRHKMSVNAIKTKYNDTWEGYMEGDVHKHGICRLIPIIKAPEISQILNLGRRRRKKGAPMIQNMIVGAMPIGDLETQKKETTVFMNLATKIMTHFLSLLILMSLPLKMTKYLLQNSLARTCTPNLIVTSWKIWTKLAWNLAYWNCGRRMANMAKT